MIMLALHVPSAADAEPLRDAIFAGSDGSTIHVRWALVSPPSGAGFLVDRQVVPDGDWVRVTADPVVFLPYLPRIHQTAGDLAPRVLEAYGVRGTPFDFSPSQLNALTSDSMRWRAWVDLQRSEPRVTDAIAQSIIDSTAPRGSPVRYRVREIVPSKGDNGGRVVGLSNVVQSGVPSSIPVPRVAEVMRFDSTRVRIVWHVDASANVLGYVVERRGTGEYHESVTRLNAALVMTSPMDTLAQLVDSLPPPGRFGYTVHAVDGIGRHGVSSEVRYPSATLRDAPRPARDIEVSVRAGGLLVHWYADLSGGALPIAAWSVERSQDSGATWEHLPVPRDATEYLDTRVVPGLPAIYRIAARASNGVDSAPNVSSPTVLTDAIPPACATQFVAEVVDGRVVLRWQRPPDADFAGVTVERERLPDEAWRGLVTHPLRAEMFVDSTLGALSGEAHYRLSSVDYSDNVRPNCVDTRVQLGAESIPAVHGSDRNPR